MRNVVCSSEINIFFCQGRFSDSPKIHSATRALTGNPLLVLHRLHHHFYFDYMNLITKGPLLIFRGNIIHDLNHTNCVFITEIRAQHCVCVSVLLVLPDVIYPLQRETMGNANTSPERNPPLSFPPPFSLLCLCLCHSFLLFLSCFLPVIPVYVSLPGKAPRLLEVSFFFI